MLNEIKSIEGVILRSTAYRDYDQILTLFTPDQGVLKFIYKGSRKKRTARGCFNPLTRVELTYKEGKSELYPCEDIVLIDSYLDLRKQLACLEAACDLLAAVSFSQWIGKVAPPIYHLLTFYLAKMSLVQDPWSLASSFRLKILKYEGVFDPQKSLETPLFEEKDVELIEFLTNCRHFQSLVEKTLPEGFAARVGIFFHDQMQK